MNVKFSLETQTLKVKQLRSDGINMIPKWISIIPNLYPKDGKIPAPSSQNVFGEFPLNMKIS